MTFKRFRFIVTPLLKFFSFILRPFTGNFAAPYRAKDEENIRLNMAVVSDVHLDSRPERIRKLKNGLLDLQEAKTPNDVLVSVGDTTDHGFRQHWDICERIFKEYRPAENIMIALGNHDMWSDNDNNLMYERLFKFFTGKISGENRENTYFAKKIKGYTLICLAMQQDDNGIYISDEQISMLKDEMDNADAEKPVFVFMHQCINISHGLPYTWERRWKYGERLPNTSSGGIGVRSDEIEAILKTHKNVFFVSGHIHLGLSSKRRYEKYGYCSIENDGGLHRVNVPCFMFPNQRGLVTSGIGFQFEVYDDSVLIRPRSYASRIWYSSYDTKIDLIH